MSILDWPDRAAVSTLTIFGFSAACKSFPVRFLASAPRNYRLGMSMILAKVVHDAAPMESTASVDLEPFIPISESAYRSSVISARHTDSIGYKWARYVWIVA